MVKLVCVILLLTLIGISDGMEALASLLGGGGMGGAGMGLTGGGGIGGLMNFIPAQYRSMIPGGGGMFGGFGSMFGGGGGGAEFMEHIPPQYRAMIPGAGGNMFGGGFGSMFGGGSPRGLNSYLKQSAIASLMGGNDFLETIPSSGGSMFGAHGSMFGGGLNGLSGQSAGGTGSKQASGISGEIQALFNMIPLPFRPMAEAIMMKYSKGDLGGKGETSGSGTKTTGTDKTIAGTDTTTAGTSSTSTRTGETSTGTGATATEIDPYTGTGSNQNAFDTIAYNFLL